MFLNSVYSYFVNYILSCNNVLQYYCFHYIFDQINAALGEHKKLASKLAYLPETFEQ